VVFEAIQALHTTGEAVDTVTVTDWLAVVTASTRSAEPRRSTT
jgi:replicative DNA helicase